jgi:hypothetical protein
VNRNHMHHWTLTKRGAWCCACGAQRSVVKLPRRRGPGRTKGSKNDPKDYTPASIDKLFAAAKARLKWERNTGAAG